MNTYAFIIGKYTFHNILNSNPKGLTSTIFFFFIFHSHKNSQDANRGKYLYNWVNKTNSRYQRWCGKRVQKSLWRKWRNTANNQINISHLKLISLKYSFSFCFFVWTERFKNVCREWNGIIRQEPKWTTHSCKLWHQPNVR